MGPVMEHHDLPEIPVFSGLSGEQIQELGSWLKRVDYPAGAHIYKDGSVADGMLVLSRGELEVRKTTVHGPVLLARLTAPSVVGEMGLLTEEQRNADIYAITSVVAGVLRIETFEEKIEANNLTALRIGVNLGRIVSQRARIALDKMVALAQKAPKPEQLKKPDTTSSATLTALRQSHVEGGTHYDTGR